MPSPFPGVDPFIEGYVWSDFHHHFIEEIAATLVSDLRPRYIIRVEERIYLEHQPDEDPRVRLPDVSIMDSHRTGSRAKPKVTAGAVAEPIALPFPLPEEVKERYLEIRERETMELVTVIEILSPTNKRRGSDGRVQYLQKREQVILSWTGLVEIDLLRGGDRMPMARALPPADFYVVVKRTKRREVGDVYSWTLRQPLPTIQIPLAADEPMIPINLQAVYTSVYDRWGYDYSLDYQRDIAPKMSESDADWVRETLTKSSAVA